MEQNEQTALVNHAKGNLKKFQLNSHSKIVGWRRMESTHLDHLDEEGHDNVSLVTEDYSAIPALDDSAMTFYTAKNSVRQSIG